MADAGYRRPEFETLLARLAEPRRFLQVLAGPRQVGKTTIARQVLDVLDMPGHYASADSPTLQDRAWVEAQWEIGRLRAGQHGQAVLILDEVQKITAWSDVVKRLWDEDTARGTALRVVLLGSAPLLVSQGLTEARSASPIPEGSIHESLAGRFELIRVPHWSYAQMRAAFGWGLDQYVYFGGYPGAAPLADDPARWASYILDSLVETTLARDVLLMTRVDKPALLRQLFRLACDYSGQILSYQKMVGQLQDAGNTTTLAGYLRLLEGAGLVTGLEKFSGARVRQRGSSPKLVVLNTALMSASSGVAPEQARARGDLWGRLVESAVGAHLLNSRSRPGIEVTYWRDGGAEVDYVLRSGDALVGLEVKSGRADSPASGLRVFADAYQPTRTLLVGGDGIPLEEFLSVPADRWLE